MLKPIANPSTKVPSSFIHSSKPFLCGDGTSWMSLPPPPRHSRRRAVSQRSTTGSKTGGRISCVADTTAGAVVAAERNKPSKVKALVKVHGSVGGMFAHITRVREDLADLFGKNLILDLVSAELDPETGLEKETIQAFANRSDREGDELEYEAYFQVPANFGEIGAVLVENEENREMFVKEIILSSSDDDYGKLTHTINCQSWIHAKSHSHEKRIFFTSKSYLPSDTPDGLERLRKKELEAKRGDGTGERHKSDRIYDYDVYNDLGDPDKSDDLARPVLGGNKQFPYPRRCRTGRARTKKDPHSEARASDNYVPRDENFSEVKQATFSAKTVRSVLQALVPSIQTAVIDTKLGFPYLTAVDSLFNEGIPLPKAEGFDLFRSFVPRLVKAIKDSTEELLQFETPELMDRDKFAWFRDEEFARQTLAGINPYSIKLITEFPLVSKLDPEIYGPPDSLITGELIEEEIKGVISIEQAIKQKRLFIVDYHDLLLPYVHKVREIEGTTLYGSRTVFFLTKRGTLRPLAIELTRPKSPTEPQWRQVFTPCWDSTNAWLWKLAKAHALAHDSGVHQLFVHWLRTHCATEPYIIAANRQLSEMHPIYRLLHPHFRYTMEINQLARVYLISGDGIIESAFSPGKYSIELSAVMYDKLWRFDTEALPADLVARGMAVEDPTAVHGVKLVIEDYPYANDGLLIWDAIRKWVTDYVNHYYDDDKAILNDMELQAWWTEIRTVGHGDKKDEPWWLEMNSRENLIHILNTIIWVASGYHAAVNFGQYHYAGYFPNRPTIARRPMPVEDGVCDEDFQRFFKKPERALCSTFPTQIQATVVMAVLDILSGHSPDEEYIGDKPELPWAENPVINAAFERFGGRLKEIEGIIDGRNSDPALKNRCGAGIVPYELLKPYSEPGVTGMGIPNSISI